MADKDIELLRREAYVGDLAAEERLRRIETRCSARVLYVATKGDTSHIYRITDTETKLIATRSARIVGLHTLDGILIDVSKAGVGRDLRTVVPFSTDFRPTASTVYKGKLIVAGKEPSQGLGTVHIRESDGAEYLSSFREDRGGYGPHYSVNSLCSDDAGLYMILSQAYAKGGSSSGAIYLDGEFFCDPLEGIAGLGLGLITSLFSWDSEVYVSVPIAPFCYRGECPPELSEIVALALDSPVKDAIKETSDFEEVLYCRFGTTGLATLIPEFTVLQRLKDGKRTVIPRKATLVSTGGELYYASSEYCEEDSTSTGTIYTFDGKLLAEFPGEYITALHCR